MRLRNHLWFTVLAGLLTAAIGIGLNWNPVAEAKGKPGGGGGGGNEEPLPGTIFFSYNNQVWGMNPDGSGKQQVLPDGLFAVPSNRVYGSDSFNDRWWIRVEDSTEFYDHWILPDGSVFQQPPPSREIYAYHSTAAPQGIRITDVFGKLFLMYIGGWANSADDAVIVVVAQDIEGGVTVDPVTGVTLDERGNEDINLYLVNVSATAIDADPENWTPVTIDASTTDIVMAYHQLGRTGDFALSPDLTEIVDYRTAGMQKVALFDANPSVTPLITEFNPTGAAWCPNPEVNQIAWTATQLGVVPADGSGEPTVILSNKGWEWFGSPKWSPDGNYILFSSTYRRWDDPTEYDIMSVSASGGKANLLTGDLPANAGKSPIRWVSNDAGIQL